MESYSTPIGSPSAPAVRVSQIFTPKELRSLIRREMMRVPYRDRVERARIEASIGLGFEDLVVSFNISERDARHIVFGRT